MASERLILVFLVTLLPLLVLSDACGSGYVKNLILNSNGILSWVTPTVTNKSCSLSYYLVFIENNDYRLVHEIHKKTALDVSSLPMCIYFTFTVIPIYGYEEGRPQEIVAKTPPKKDESFEVHFVNITQTSTDLYVEWATKKGAENCLSRFRFTYWNDYNDIPTDVQVKNNSYVLKDLILCLNYKIEVRVILDNFTEGPSKLMNFTLAALLPASPILLDVAQYPTKLKTLWKVQNTKENRCPLLRMILDASPSFNLTIPINNTVVDQINITLQNLSPNTAYVTKAYLVNNAGVSLPLNTILETSPNITRWYW